MHETKNLILLYFSCRSGSTFTGYLLSASSSAVYVFEPFQHFIVNGSDIEDAITSDKNNYLHAKAALEKVFNLDLQMLPGRWLFFIYFFIVSKEKIYRCLGGLCENYLQTQSVTL